MKSVERTPKTHAYLNLGSPLSAISASHDGSSLIVAGRDTVKIVSLENDEQPKVVINLRAGKTQSLNYTGNDCCWHPSQVENYKYLISTAATNGAVVVWNITREGARSVEKVWTDHNRAVNKLAWHPEKSDFLLTGSQDTTLKLSDIREATPCKITFQPKSEAVRDVQFHPFNSVQFAAAFDNGTVQLWDIRKNTQAVEKITAHQGLVLSIEWHPEEKNIIASGGRDRAIRVWDISTGKLLNNVSTISSVSRIKWRPNQRWQIASCSSIVDLQTHIWDVKRPFIPIASLREHRDVPTGLIWRDTNTLITCSKDNYLLINDLNTDAYQPYKHIRTTGIGWNVQNDLVTINDKINRTTNNESIPLSMQYPSFFASFNQAAQPPPSPQRTEKGVLFIHSPLGAAGKTDKIVDPSILFEYFAKSYKFKGMPFRELCQHNESVALRVNQYQIAKLWSLLKLYFDNPNDDNLDTTSSTSKGNNNNNNSKINNNDDNLNNSKQQQQQQQHNIQQNLQNNSHNSNSSNNSNNSINKNLSNNSNISGGSNSGGNVNGGSSSQVGSLGDKLGNSSLDGNSMEAAISSKYSPVFIDDQSSSASLGNSNGLLDDSDEDPIYSILSAEAVTPLVSLPARAPSPSKLDADSVTSSSSLRKKFSSFSNLNIDESEEDDSGVGGTHTHHRHHHNHRHHHSVSGDNDPIILRSISSTNLENMMVKPAADKRRHKYGSNITILDCDQSVSLFPELEIPQFEMLPVIMEILESCIERGDVQTCVFTVLIMRDKLKIESLRVSQWLSSYVELLHRFKMWNCANEIMKNCDDPSVGSLSQRSTSILVSCACGKTLAPNSWVCDKCGTVPAECSVCRLPVKGSYSWCQGCGHGGHLEHMKKWFESGKEVCPTGTCTHICKPKTTTIT